MTHRYLIAIATILLLLTPPCRAFGQPLSLPITNSYERASPQDDQAKSIIKAVYIPLADHYAGIVAYEKYRQEMRYANYQIEQMKSWPLLRARFLSGDADLAYIISPQAMDMFDTQPNFRWVSLLHRDGNALAINDLLNLQVQLPFDRKDRIPDASVAQAFAKIKTETGNAIECAVPHLQSTHTVILYKYLKEHGMTLGVDFNSQNDVQAVTVAPAKSPAFIKKNNSRAQAAAFEQSLPWADVVETQAFGKIAWYSKDVMPWPNGHVECIAIATDQAIANKNAALKEVIYYIHRAGMDIEAARLAGGSSLKKIIDMIRVHVPGHTESAIAESLRPDLMVINYRNLNLDQPGLEAIMNLAVEAGILTRPIDLARFADDQFATNVAHRESTDFASDEESP